MGCSGLLFVSIPTWIARLFSPDPMVIRTGATLLLVAAAFQLFDGLQTVATGALRGTGDTRTPMLANFIAYWLIGLPVGYVLCFKVRMGRSRGVDRIVRRSDDYRVGSSAGMASEKAAHVSRLWESTTTEKPGVSSCL